MGSIFCFGVLLLLFSLQPCAEWIRRSAREVYIGGPALFANASAVCDEAMGACAERGIPVSAGLIYRAKLWKYSKNALDRMPSVLSHCPEIMGNSWSAGDLPGIPVDPNMHERSSLEAYLDHTRKTAAGEDSKMH